MSGGLLGSAQRGIRLLLQVQGAVSRRVTLLGHPVHYYEVSGQGRASSVVLVHGLGGTANGFARILFGLAHRFSRVLALDLPGSGFSPLEGEPLALREQQDVLTRFVEVVAPSGAFVVGNSLGGAMAITLAHERPDSVSALGLIAPAGARVSDARGVEMLSAMRVTNDAEARRLVRRLFYRTPWSALLFAPELKKLYRTPAVTKVLSEVTPGDALEPEVLAGLAQPTLLVWGEGEQLLPSEGVEFFRRHLPGHADIRVVRGFGHIPQIERPREVVSLLVDFADRIGV